MRWLVAMAGLGLAAAACTGSPGDKPASNGTPAASDHSARENPTSAFSERPPTDGAEGGVHNPVFYYAGKAPLSPGADLSALGKPSIVVTTAPKNEQEAVAAIHGLGAKAYRYVQFFWAPDKGSYEGIDLGTHPDWAFCRSGDQPLRGRTTTNPDGGKLDWYFLDTNERGLRSRIAQLMASYKALGWDGLMWDRGGAATQNAVDAKGQPVWDAASSCTGHPYRTHARFADAYVNMLGLARQAGLQVMLNTGTSPYDPVRPFRPDPNDPDCRDRQWQQCSHTRDGLSDADLELNESVSFPRDEQWRRTFEGNQRAERKGRRVVGLITTHTLGGASHQNRADVFYEWARVKIFNLPLAVNTGNDGCHGSQRDVCNRYGAYPELSDIRFGKPSADSPSARQCQGGSDIRCVWSRQYAKGLDLVNVSDRALSVRVIVPGERCRRVYDVFAAEPLAGDRCVTDLSVDLPPWSGRPLLESTHPWKAG